MVGGAAHSTRHSLDWAQGGLETYVSGPNPVPVASLDENRRLQALDWEFCCDINFDIVNTDLRQSKVDCFLLRPLPLPFFELSSYCPSSLGLCPLG